MKKVLALIITLVKCGFSKYTSLKLADKGQKIYEALLNNVNFPDPVPDLPTILVLIKALQAAEVAAANGDRVAIRVREQARLNLAAALKTLGNYINYASNGSVEIAATSAFDLYKVKETITVQPIKRLKVWNLPGTNALIVAAVGAKGAKSFIHQYSSDPKLEEANWQSVNCTTRKCTIDGLLKNTEYTVRVIGIGAHGQRVISDTVTRIVQ